MVGGNGKHCPCPWYDPLRQGSEMALGASTCPPNRRVARPRHILPASSRCCSPFEPLRRAVERAGAPRNRTHTLLRPPSSFIIIIIIFTLASSITDPSADAKVQQTRAVSISATSERQPSSSKVFNSVTVRGRKRKRPHSALCFVFFVSSEQCCVGVCVCMLRVYCAGLRERSFSVLLRPPARGLPRASAAEERLSRSAGSRQRVHCSLQLSSQFSLLYSRGKQQREESAAHCIRRAKVVRRATRWTKHGFLDAMPFFVFCFCCRRPGGTVCGVGWWGEWTSFLVTPRRWCFDVLLRLDRELVEDCLFLAGENATLCPPVSGSGSREISWPKRGRTV